nr:MAG TPA: hypothetical protein [Caudoviricetes sp.]
MRILKNRNPRKIMSSYRVWINNGITRFIIVK